jgi:DNA processing protein
MSLSLSPNTQAILLLTAPLIAGHNQASADFLTQGEYRGLARFLRERQRQPADLLASEGEALIGERQSLVDRDRLKRLLGRGFLLSQAVERWQARSIWVVSRADAKYPRRLKTRLREDAPPVLYGCGDLSILETGGLAVVGSRQVDEELLSYTEGIGRLAAGARRTLVSGGARGVDQAAMRGALEAGGQAVGVLADSLERAALNREHRNPLMSGKLALVSPYDPAAGFNVGHAMQRNKSVYALADAALVINSDYQKGGTWAGAVEQLEKLKLIPVYVRSHGQVGRGLEALRQRGALPWPGPETTEALQETLALETAPEQIGQGELFSGTS